MGYNLLRMSLLEIRALIDKRDSSYREVNEFFLTRSKKYNPELNAYVALLDKPSECDIQIAIKDNFCTKGLRTTASSRVLDNFVPPYESTVTSRLASAHFKPLGKTNMDAWAHGASTETSDFFTTKNPHDISKVPGGSSGGTAAAIAAGLAIAGVGSDTGGSIRNPASWSGVVGLKPTYGRVSRYGLIAMASSTDCPGPMTKSVRDAAYLLGVISGVDKYDATTTTNSVPDYLSGLSQKRSMIIGIPEDYFEGIQKGVRQRLEESLKIIEKMGHKIKKIKLISPKYAVSVYTIIQRAEVSSNLGRFDGIRYGNSRESFGQEAKRRIMLGTYTLAHGYYDQYYKRAQKVRTLLINEFAETFKEVDLIVCPSAPMTAVKIGEIDKYPFFGEKMDELNEPASMTGIPSISVPCGVDEYDMPVGMQIMGKHFDESSILNLAYQFEQETNFFDVIEKGLKKWE